MTRKNILPLAGSFRAPAACRQAGFTLIELMVGMVVGLLLVLAMVTLLINVNRNNTEMGKTNLLIENGRFALQLLEDDITHAGFWNGYVPEFDNLNAVLGTVPADYPSAMPDPCLAYASWTAAVKTNLLGIAVQGYEIPLSVCAGVVTNPQPSTDVLFVRHLERSPNCRTGATTACPAPTSGGLYFQQSRCGNEPVAGPTTEAAYVFEPYEAASAATVFPLRNRNCGTVAELRQFVSNLYYVRDYATTVGDGIPTLMRSSFGPVTTGGVTTLEFQPAQAIVEGIEGFRVEYGVDSLSDSGAAVNFGEAINWTDPFNRTSPTNRGDGMPDGNYVRCTTASPCNVDQMANTVVVRIHVLARSRDRTNKYTDTKTYVLGGTTLGPFNDNFKRHVFTQTIRLNNISSRRETS